MNCVGIIDLGYQLYRYTILVQPNNIYIIKEILKMGNPYNAYTRLEKFNILCGEIIDKYCMELPIADDEIISKYATMILYSLVYSLKEFSNSEKSISDIDKIHKVCKNMFDGYILEKLKEI